LEVCHMCDYGLISSVEVSWLHFEAYF
jgi:hypothetical protein